MTAHEPRYVRAFPVKGKKLCGLTWFHDLLWYSDAALEQIMAIEHRTGAVVRTIACPGVRTGLTSRQGKLLQVVGPGRSLRVIDPATGDTIEEFANPRPGGVLCGIEATGDDNVWMGYEEPSSLELRGTPDFDLIDVVAVDEKVAGVTVTDRCVVFASYSSARITSVHLATKQVMSRMRVIGNPTGLTWDGSHFWYCDYANSYLRAVEGSVVADGE